MQYQYVRISPNVVRATDEAGAVSWVSVSDPAVQQAIAAGLVLPAAPAPILKHDRGLFEGDAHTSEAESSEMFRRTLPTLSQFSVTMTASGIAVDNGAQRTLWVVAVVQRLNGGAIVVGQTVYGNIASAAGSPVAAGAFVLAANGNDIVITVTGLALREIDWTLTGEYVRIRPSGF